MDSLLLSRLKLEAKKALEANSRFHDFGHALEVLDNIQKISKDEEIDEEVLFTAALFHDVSNSQDEEIEGKDGARITKEILNSISDFPKEKIDDVCRLIESLNRKAEINDEIVLDEADTLAKISKLSVCRGFMIYGKSGVKPKEAIEDFFFFIEKQYKRLQKSNHEIVRSMAEERFVFIKPFLEDCLNFYES